MRRPARITGVLVLTAVMSALPSATALAADSAVVLMYHRFGEADYPSTNVTIDQFEAHLGELTRGGYTVLPLPEIVNAIRDGRALPDRSVAITIDDAYQSVYTEAWPRLRRLGFPFTLFVATAPIDRGFERYMSWDQIRELKAAGVTIGSQTASHLHMAASAPDRNRSDLEHASDRFTTELGATPEYFAYPFGEASAEVQQVVREFGFRAAFGQHSGVTHATADPYYLPRFPLNEAFGDLSRFQLVASTLPLPVSDLTPIDPTLATNPPSFGFTLASDIPNAGALACFASDQGQTRLERLGPRIEVRLDEPFAAGRARINCTVPAGDGRWRWFGMQYYVPK